MTRDEGTPRAVERTTIDPTRSRCAGVDVLPSSPNAQSRRRRRQAASHDRTQVSLARPPARAKCNAKADRAAKPGSCLPDAQGLWLPTGAAESSCGSRASDTGVACGSGTSTKRYSDCAVLGGHVGINSRSLSVIHARSLAGRTAPGPAQPHPEEQQDEGVASGSAPIIRDAAMIAALTIRSSGMAS